MGIAELFGPNDGFAKKHGYNFFVPASARQVFGATDPQSDLYTQGIEWGGFAFAFYSISAR